MTDFEKALDERTKNLKIHSGGDYRYPPRFVSLHTRQQLKGLCEHDTPIEIVTPQGDVIGICLVMSATNSEESKELLERHELNRTKQDKTDTKIARNW